MITHTRCKNRIQDDNGHVNEYSSINKAKKASREMGGFRTVRLGKLGPITGTSVMYKAKSPHDYGQAA